MKDPRDRDCLRKAIGSATGIFQIMWWWFIRGKQRKLTLNWMNVSITNCQHNGIFPEQRIWGRQWSWCSGWSLWPGTWTCRVESCGCIDHACCHEWDTNSPTIMIAEKLSDAILGKHHCRVSICRHGKTETTKRANVDTQIGCWIRGRRKNDMIGYVMVGTKIWSRCFILRCPDAPDEDDKVCNEITPRSPHNLRLRNSSMWPDQLMETNSVLFTTYVKV